MAVTSRAPWPGLRNLRKATDHASVGIPRSAVGEKETPAQVVSKASWKKTWAGPWPVSIWKGGKEKEGGFRRGSHGSGDRGRKQPDPGRALTGEAGSAGAWGTLVSELWATVRLWGMLTTHLKSLHFFQRSLGAAGRVWSLWLEHVGLGTPGAWQCVRCTGKGDEWVQETHWDVSGELVGESWERRLEWWQQMEQGEMQTDRFKGRGDMRTKGENVRGYQFITFYNPSSRPRTLLGKWVKTGSFYIGSNMRHFPSPSKSGCFLFFW